MEWEKVKEKEEDQEGDDLMIQNITGLSMQEAKKAAREPETTAKGDKKSWKSPEVAPDLTEQVTSKVIFWSAFI